MTARTLPYGPLADFLRRRGILTPTGRLDFDGTPAYGQRQEPIYLAARNGYLTANQADKIACMFGVPPQAIWGDDWYPNRLKVSA